MSATEDDTPDHADSGKRGSVDTLYSCKMILYGRELCFLLAIAFTSYAALHNAPPLVSKVLPAIPFFPRDSLVEDYYHGELSPAFERISECDLSFVMYYAPWDAESQAVRAQFDVLASYYKDQIYFAAINCWHPSGECRRHFAKVQQFPVLIAYPALRGKGVQYRGIRKAPHMARFLHTALRPLSRVEAPSDVLALFAAHDAVAVGCVEASKRSQGYQSLYTAALRALERDPFQEVAFAVATSKAACLRLGNAPELPMPFLRLYLWNETLLYQGAWSGDNLVRWVFSSTHQVAVWVSLPGAKALSLAPFVEEGPALMLFTPRNPFYSETPYFELLKEVGLDYYNCHSNTWVNRLSHFLASERTVRKQRHRNSEKACFTSLLNDRYTSCPRPTKIPTCATVTLPGAANLTKGTKLPSSKLLLGPGWAASCKETWACENDPWRAKGCLRASLRSTPEPHVGNETSQSSDDRIAALGKVLREERCRRLLLGRRLQRAVFPRRSPDVPMTKLKGLACSNNRSLSVLALDSLEFHFLAEQIGVDVLNRPEKTVAIIFNAGQESHHVLEQPVTKESLAHFLINHTEGTLTRSMRSLTKPQENDVSCPEGSICVRELTSHTFLPVVLDNEKDVVVLYHSPYCGLCGTASLAFLTVARLFRHTPQLEFARIDGDNSDLPWEFTMDTFPTIIFFPAERKSESRVFPRSKPVSVDTMTHFILANLHPESRLKALLGFNGGRHLARLHTLAALDELVSQRRHLGSQSLESSSLLQWRRLLQRSQYLRLLHLALAAKPLEHEATHSLHRYYALPTNTIQRVSIVKTPVERDEL